ncbi:MAG: valine--pyruvate transaminase [Bacteroidota bacterium]
MKLSKTGVTMSRLTGVRAIMKDIQETLKSRGGKDTFYNFGAGNPVILSEIENLWKDCTNQLIDSLEYGQVIGNHGGSKGYPPLIEAVIRDFNERFSLDLNQENILITLGSQSLYLYAANTFGGYTKSGNLKNIVLPLSPDYTGYGGISFSQEALVAFKPIIEVKSEHRFKYRPDIENVKIDENTGLVLFSRPSNPTGNIITNTEVNQLVERAAKHKVPVFIDSAYGPPYPALNFQEMSPIFEDNVVHCASLSKVGLAGERIGIAIGNANLIRTLESFQQTVCDHSSRYGQAIAAKAIASGKLENLVTAVVKPFYQNKRLLMEQAIEQFMPSELPWLLHECEGGMFSWLWFKDLPITDWELYQELKAENVIVVPGSPFFYGFDEDWSHRHQCIRLSFTAKPEEIHIGIEKLAKVINNVYRAS